LKVTTDAHIYILQVPEEWDSKWVFLVLTICKTSTYAHICY